MKVQLCIELEVEADGIADAVHVVDGYLDAGELQEALNGHDCDAGPLRVLSAVVVMGGCDDAG